MRKQVTDYAELAGKTIEAVDDDCENVYMTFTDATFCAFSLDGCEGTYTITVRDQTNIEIAPSVLIKLGICTQEEWDRAREEKEDRYREMRRGEYMRLKKEFEG